MTVRTALEDYLRHDEQRHKASYQVDCRRMLDAELAKLADKPVADLDGERVLKWFREQVSGSGSRRGRVLRAVLRHADRVHDVRSPNGKVATEIIGDQRLPRANRRKPRSPSHATGCIRLDRCPEP